MTDWRDRVLPTHEPTKGHIQKRQDLFNLMHQYFSNEELKTLCFSIGIDYDDLGADGKEEIIRELLFKVFKQLKSGVFLVELERIRPGVEWRGLL